MPLVAPKDRLYLIFSEKGKRRGKLKKTEPRREKKRFELAIHNLADRRGEEKGGPKRRRLEKKDELPGVSNALSREKKDGNALSEGRKRV